MEQDEPVISQQEHHDVVGHASADDEYLVTPPGAGYEHTDASVWIIVKFGLWLAIAAIIVHVGMVFVFALFVEQREESDPTFPLAVGQERRLPSEPRLQAIPENDAYQFRLREQQAMESYRWVDQEAGRVQIPIGEAMRMIVEQGLPVRAGQPDDAPVEPPDLMPADSSAGRTMERRRQ